jgi:AraC-like DNA-binding protein
MTNDDMLSWRTTHELELSADYALLVESLVDDDQMIRQLTRVGGHELPDVSVLTRRYRNAFRIGGPSALLVTRSKTRLRCHHKMRVAPLRIERLCRSLAIADLAMNACPAAAALLPSPTAAVSAGQGDRHAAVVWAASLPVQALVTPLAVEHWIALEALRPSAAGADVLDHLRRQEPYELTRFLLQAELDAVDLKVLARRYGLSYSQFRMLCKRTLGASAKSELNRWRAGRALLGLLLNGDSVIDAAVANGYASASHISTDIKREFGIAPSHFIHPNIDQFVAGRRV